jgi:hypothetical protein
MRWEGANVKEKQEDRRDDSKKSSETVEAALARLGRSYAAAMNCIGSLHRLDLLGEKDDTSLESMQRVANAARSTLERTVLIDPLVAETLAPCWYQVVNKACHENQDRWAFVQETRPHPALLTSSSHRSTVLELAYLSLVNYADLLVKACRFPTKDEGSGILTRGVVPHVPPLHWNEEEVEFIQRLAVAALCDASELDGSDPTLWLKLACAARRLTLVSGESYDRLERHALERGRTALPPDVPPNRLIVRALEQHLQEKESCQEYPYKLHTQEETPSLVLDLPRYSWSMLGRMLLRACREGNEYRPHYYSTTAENAKQPFGSPCIVLKLSPMLALPSEALGTICQFLDSASVWKFEATCRALSASILSARTFMERRSETNNDVAAQDKKPEEEPSGEAAAAAAAAANTNPTGSLPSISTGGGASAEQSASSNRQTSSGDQNAASNRQTSGGDQSTASNRQTSGGGGASENEEQAASSYRTSKRVQSKRITSGKLAERKAKRNSVEFCFIAALFGCTKGDDKYQTALKEEIKWDEQAPGDLRIQSSLPQEGSPTKSTNKQQRDTAGIQARLGDASLSTFVETWSAKNSGPLDILSRYLSHIAMNVEQVFTVDSDNTLALPPFIIDCKFIFMLILLVGDDWCSSRVVFLPSPPCSYRHSVKEEWFASGTGAFMVRHQ